MIRACDQRAHVKLKRDAKIAELYCVFMKETRAWRDKPTSPFGQEGADCREKTSAVKETRRYREARLFPPFRIHVLSTHIARRTLVLKRPTLRTLRSPSTSVVKGECRLASDRFPRRQGASASWVRTPQSDTLNTCAERRVLIWKGQSVHVGCVHFAGVCPYFGFLQLSEQPTPSRPPPVC